MTEVVERWLPVVGWEGLYEVSNLSRVRSLPRKGTRGGVMCQSVDKMGYKVVGLRKAGERKLRFVHALVAEAFIGPRPDGMECCHWDGKPHNNLPANLRWDTKAGNCADRARHGTNNNGERHGAAKLTEEDVLAIRRDCRYQKEIAIEYKVSKSLVSLIQRRERWAHVP